MSTEVSILDDVEQIRSADPGNMYNRVFDLPEHMAEALKIADAWKVSAGEFSDPKNIVFIGMGGSAIGGDLIRAFLRDRLLVPFTVCRDYSLPEYVDDETLVIASSYSGNTEETLFALNDALERKAMVAAISTGGLMKDVAEINGIPMAILPEGIQPRAALGYSVVPILMFFEKIGLIKDARKDVESAIAKLQIRREKYIEDSPLASNPAKSLANHIHGRTAIIYGGPILTEPVAHRWKAQFCENGKNMAFASIFPECNHNELVSWNPTVLGDQADKFVVFMLRDEGDGPKIRKRMNIVKTLIERIGTEVHDVHSMGERPFERMLSLVQLGDFVSYYLAVLNGVDPTPVEVIEQLKRSLTE